MDRETSSRPERRTALIAKELSRYNIDIAALSVTRLADEGSVAEPKGGYTFLWKGKDQDEKRIHGIGLAIRSKLLQQLPDLPTAINERLMKLCFPLNTSRNITVISVYGPTVTSSEEAKETFYEGLNNLVKAVPPGDTLILLVDFNARVGTNYTIWKSILGPHDARDFRITRAMRGAECWTDHRLVRSVVKLYIGPTHRKKSKSVRPSYNIAKHRHPFHQDYLVSSLDNKLTSHGPFIGNPAQQWDQFNTMVKEAAQPTLGPKKRVHQDWFDENDEAITQLLGEKQKAYLAWQNDITSNSRRDHFKHLQRCAQTGLHHMQDEWWNKKADKVQLYADTITQGCSSVPSRQCMDHLDQAPPLFCQRTAHC
ncbi:hypothetical protein ACOMHN_036482 [Nucella lapillus]